MTYTALTLTLLLVALVLWTMRDEWMD